MKTRGQKAVINTIVLATYQLVVFICGLILPRYILTYFGSEYNGITSSINQFLGFIDILQMGIAGATRFALYKVLAVKDNIGISGIVNATEKYMRKIGSVLLVYIFVMMLFYPYVAKTDLPTNEIRLLVLILGITSFMRYFFGITYQILLNADQKQYFYNIIITIATLINLIVAVILMKCGQNIFIVKSGSAFIFVLVPIILSILVKKLYSIDKTVPPDNSGIKGRWDVMWHSIANIVHNNTSLVVLTLFADVKLVSVYTVYYLVINGLHKILSIFTNSLEAAFGNMFAKKEVNSAYKHLENYEFFMCSFVSVVFSCALVLIVPFVKVYTSGVTDINYVEPVFAIFAVVAQMIICIRQPYLTVVQAAGHYKQTRNGAFLEAGINIALTIILTPKLGLIGVAIGTFVSNLVRTLQYIFYLRNNIINRSVIKPIFSMVWTAFNVTVITLIGTKIVNCILVDSWLSWILCGGVCFAIAFIITIISSIIFYKEKLLDGISTIKRMIKI